MNIILCLPKVNQCNMFHMSFKMQLTTAYSIGSNPISRIDPHRDLGIMISSNLSWEAITAPLRDLLKTDVHFQWDTHHEAALTKIKEEISSTPVLTYFDPNKISMIQAGASKHGLGACLHQQGKPTFINSSHLRISN